AMYSQRAKVEGLTGSESNPAPDMTDVKVFRLENFTPADPPHDWNSCHSQFDMGKNDGFVKAHAGSSQNDVIGYHDRSQIPFYYWLADNFTVCDHWHASVMGPTWPNRYYMHSASSAGAKSNSAPSPLPDTIWERLEAKGVTYKNYYAGIGGFYLL